MWAMKRSCRELKLERAALTFCVGEAKIKRLDIPTEISFWQNSF